MHEPGGDAQAQFTADALTLVEHVVAHVGSGGVRNLDRLPRRMQTLEAGAHRQGGEVRLLTARSDRLIAALVAVVIFNTGGVQVDSDLFEADHVAANRHAQADERVGLHILQGGAQGGAGSVVADGQLPGDDVQIRAHPGQQTLSAFGERYGGVHGHAGKRAEEGQQQGACLVGGGCHSRSRFLRWFYAVLVLFGSVLFGGVLFGGAALQVLGERLQQLFGGGDDDELVQVAFVEQAGGRHVVHGVDELVPVAVDVQQRDRLGVNIEELPAENFKELFEGARAAGHGDKRVSLVNHGDFALVHGVHNVEGGLAGVHALQANQLVGDHAVNYAAGVQGCARNGAHEAGAAAAVHHANIVLGAEGAELLGAGGEERVVAGACPAVDGEVVVSLLHGSPWGVWGFPGWSASMRSTRDRCCYVEGTGCTCVPHVCHPPVQGARQGRGLR